MTDRYWHMRSEWMREHAEAYHAALLRDGGWTALIAAAELWERLSSAAGWKP